MKIYRIAKWNEVFERSDTRKLKVLSWVAIPTSFSSHGYQSMLDEFGDDAASIYGAWCALVCIAASCTVRGTLANSRGIPLPVTHLVRMSGLPQPVFEKLIAWASRPGINWLEEIEHVSTEENTDFSTEKHQSGISPDDLPTISHQPDDISRLPDKTRQDQTGPNPTRPDKTRPDPPSVGRQSVVGLDSVSWESVKRSVEKFRRVSGTSSEQLDTSSVLMLAVLTEMRKSGLISTIANDIRNGRVRSLNRFVSGTIRKQCEEISIDQQTFERDVLKLWQANAKALAAT